MSEAIPKRYHPIQVVIHWLMALLVFMMLGVGKFFMPGISSADPQKPMMLQSHTFIGGAIAVLLVIRLIMRFAVKQPAADTNAGNAFLEFIAKATHILLYVLMFGMAVSGLGLFQMANLPAVFSGAQPYPQDFFEFLPRLGHGLSSTLLLLLIVLHFGAAMYHQFIKKDNLLSRMWFGRN
ncbi:MAG: cytochrome b/b6 domain-containing protein [Chloroflexi bacterium]|nr:cytochrome b/b6 domain-containing protein [Chloroflexota bacterium]